VGHGASERSFYAMRAKDGLVYTISAQNVSSLFPDLAQLLPGNSESATTPSQQ